MRVADRPCDSNSSSARRRQTNRAPNTNNSRHSTDTHNSRIQDIEDNPPYFGDFPRKVKRDCLRIASLNINRLQERINNPKDEILFKSINQYDIDILNLQEVGLNWYNIPRHDNWHSRTDLHLKAEMGRIQSKMSHNTRDKTNSKLQWGGTGIMSNGKISYFSMGAGSDSSGLGRWTWTRYRGKDGIVLRCVSVYQPNSNKEGTLTVYQQHKEYLQSINDDRDPRAAFMEDLDNSLTEWSITGDQIILSGDINEHIFHPSIVDFFEKHNMRNLMYERHEQSNAPPTYLHTTSTTRIVDGIWGTPNITAHRCGYLEPGDFPSDHSLLWIDITYNSALGHNPPQPQRPDARRLQLWNTKCTKKYLKTYKTTVLDNNLHIRQRNFARQTAPGSALTPAQKLIANAIDETRHKFMTKAERKCRHIRAGAVSFSEATEQPRREISFWETAIRRRLGTRVSPSLWKRRKNKAQIHQDTANMTIQQLYDSLKASRQTYRQARDKHKEERIKFLDTMKPKDRDRLKRREQARDLGRAAKLVSGKLESKSVTKIEIDGKECTEKEEMEEALKHINYNKLRMCDNTPLLRPPLRQIFGDKNNPQNVSDILNGTFTLPDTCDKYVQLLIKGLKQPETLRPHNRPFHPRTKISTEDHIAGWKKMKERTSSGMSGLHFGMFKANATDPLLAELDASIRNIAYTTGHSYNRWKRGLDVQLLKRSQDFRAEKLRTILLLEADFNLNNKVLGSDAMRSGERAKALARDNYGGRRNLRANEVAMNSQLTYNSIWSRRMRAILMSNDAKGCFDSILHIIVDIALQRLGACKTALESMLETIQAMEHFIRTAFGDSDTPYKRKPGDPPPQGILQGNGAAGAGWSSISSVLIEIMLEHGYGYREWTLIRQRLISIVCFAFVDDTDLIHINNDPHKTPCDLIRDAQSALSLWEGLLRATGGNLAPSKSYWYYIEVIRKNGSWQYQSESAQPGTLHLNNNNHTVQRHDPHTAEEALGIQSSPDGKMTAEYKYIKQKIAKWCDAIRTKRLHKSEAWYCLNSTIMKTIEYPLMATSFTKNEIDDLMKPLFKTALPLSGIQRKLPRALVYGTLRSRGCNIHYPYWTQLIHHLQAILRHQHRDTPSRDLHEDNMESTQIHVGSQHPFWELPFPLYGHLAPRGWMKNTWEALQQTPLTLKGPDITIPPQRENDQWLMDVLLSIHTDDNTAILLNDCRLHLQATLLSDITSADGTTIDINCWEGRPSPNRKPEHWIKTYRPGRDAWIQWQQALKTAFLQPHTQHRRLSQPLGRWLHTSDKTWIWWKHLPSSTIYQRLPHNSWLSWSLRNQRTTSTPSYHHPTPCTELPINCVRTSVKQRHSLSIQELNWGISVPPTPANPPAALSDTLRQYPSSAHWALKHIKIQDGGNTIAQALQSHTALAVSDGSLKYGYGTASYIIEGPNSDNHIVGVNEVPGPISEGDSHRCEVSGIYSIVLIISAIVTHFNITSGSITIACDNETSLRIFDLDYKPDPQHKNFDLVLATWTIATSLPIKWQPTHVYGHQESRKSFASLSRIEKLNVAMDLTAKSFWNALCVHNHRLQMIRPKSHPIHSEGWQLWQGNTKITRPSIKTLYSIIQDPVTQQWWVRNNHVKETASNLADWEATADLLQHLPLPRRRWVTKTASHNCGVGTTLQSWNFQDHSTCPRCSATEDTTHVYQCTGHNATEIWNKSIDRLQTYLTTHHTDPELATCLITCLQQWRRKEKIHLTSYPEELKQLIRDQRELNWQNLLEGLPVKRWRLLQHNYYKRSNIRKSSTRWLRGMLQHVHHLAWNQWDHRNKIKHNIVRPETKRALNLLHSEITREYLQGHDTLLPSDRHHLRHNLANILSKTIEFKKAWLVNITTARQRMIRIQQHDEERNTKSRETSTLIRWFKTGRLHS